MRYCQDIYIQLLCLKSPSLLHFSVILLSSTGIKKSEAALVSNC